MNKNSPVIFLLTCIVSLVSCPVSAQEVIEQPPAEKDSFAEESVDEISRKLENPLTTLWSLTFQENYSIIKGDAIEGSEWGNNLFFQPALPVPVGKNHDKVLIIRPVFPWVRSAIYDPAAPGGVIGSDTGLGDIQTFVMIGPNASRGKVWGIGATFKFDTASSDALGQGKNQAGPAAMFLNIGKNWTTGVVVQHWWSYAGDEDRADTSQTDLQYIMRRALPGGWSIGMGPTVTFDWKAPSGEKVTFPIGLGITKTVKWGGTPIKMRLEPQYSIIKPDHLGTAWNIRLQFTPVIKSPFMK
ncbi:MAG: hypothetical protein OEU84_06930 [Xanthomonadales bacterium]|nr:hypothetical protein [Xanthomonadales bacterium]